MTVAVHVWRPFAADPEISGDGSSSSARSQISGLIGGFGHVAVSVDADYLSYWPGDVPGEHASFAFSADEDLARCRRKPDSIVVVRGLDEEPMLEVWEQESREPFHSMRHNCCTVSARLIFAGFEHRADEQSCWEAIKMSGRILLRPIRSSRAMYGHMIRDTTGFHDPSQVERLAETVRDLVGP